jgi:hypothetical protein
MCACLFQIDTARQPSIRGYDFDWPRSALVNPVLPRRAIRHNSIFLEFAVDPMDAVIEPVLPDSWNGHGCLRLLAL